MNIPEIPEMRDLMRYMDSDQRKDLAESIFCYELDLSLLASHELERFSFLMHKLGDAWPCCDGHLSRLSLLEILTTFGDDEARDFIFLHQWARGDKRPSDHPLIDEDGYRFYLNGDKKKLPVGWTNRAGPPHYTPDQPLCVAQRLVGIGTTP